MSKTINFNVTDDVLEPFYAVELMFNGNIVTPYNVNIVSTGDGNKYAINQQQQYELVVGIGNTVQFLQDDNSNTSHPLKLSTTPDGTHGGGTEYTTGVTYVGVPGQSGSYTQWVVDASLNYGDVLYYYCQNHAGMGGQVSITNAEQRFWTGYGQITVGGNTYYGSGDLGSVSEVVETQKVQSNGLNVSLSGIPSNLMYDALLQDYQGQVANVYFGTLTNGALTVQPYLIFSGYMDVMNVLVEGETANINITLENKIADLLRTKVARYTNEDQISRYPGDTSLRFVDAIQSDKEILWGVDVNTVGRTYVVPTPEELLDDIKNGKIRIPF